MSDGQTPTASTLAPEVVAMLPEQFQKSADPIGELVKAYKSSGGEALKLKQQVNDFETKFKAPENYEIDPVKIGYDPGKMVLAVAKDANVPQEMLEAVLKGVGEHVLPEVKKAAKAIEIKGLGQDWKLDPKSAQFKEKFDGLMEWSKKNNPAELHAALSTSAEGVKAIEAMRSAKAASQRMADFDTAAPQTKDKREQVRELTSDPRYVNDFRFQEMANKKIREIFGE